jgi:hypothetical protein
VQPRFVRDRVRMPTAALYLSGIVFRIRSSPKLYWPVTPRSGESLNSRLVWLAAEMGIGLWETRIRRTVLTRS